MAGQAHPTTNHDEIRNWAEQRGGRPARVKGTGSGSDAGVLRIEFPSQGSDEELEAISWDQFFEKFDREGLAMLLQDETREGGTSRFAKIVSRRTAEQTSRH